MTVHPAKTQLSLGSEFLLCAQWVAKDPNFLHADSKDSDQPGRACHFVGFIMRRLISLYIVFIMLDMHANYAKEAPLII